MSYEMQPMYPAALQTAEEKQMGMFLHLSQLANVIIFPLGIILPIVIWQMQKDKMPALDAHGKEAVNWMISETIYLIVSIIALFLIIGIVLLPVVALLGIIFPIIGAVKANNGELWRYPLAIKFIK
jgi:uncharacterized protein